MPNIFNLSEVSYESLFSLAGINENDRDRRVRIQFDADKFAAGRKAIKDNFANLGRSRGKGEIRKNPHFLSRNYLAGKGLDCSGLGPAHKHWFCTFDLPSRGSPDDPNGPRRIIAVCENNADTNGYYSSTNGGKVIYFLYTNNHYGDNGKPAFLYLKPPAVRTSANTAGTPGA